MTDFEDPNESIAEYVNRTAKESLNDDIITTTYETEIINSQKSKSRSVSYATGALMILVSAQLVDMSSEEIETWHIALGAAVPFFDLLMASVKTWPKRLR